MRAGALCLALATGVRLPRVRAHGLLHPLKGRRLIQCYGCRRQTSVTAGTIFAGSKLPLNAWFLAMHLITQAKNGISSLELSRQMAISQNIAWPPRPRRRRLCRTGL